MTKLLLQQEMPTPREQVAPDKLEFTYRISGWKKGQAT
jgi:hypothetical protein